jgi:hypothetical protein
VLENRVLRRIFGPERQPVTGQRKIHDEELHNLYKYYSDDQIKEDEVSGACSTQGKMRNALEILVGFEIFMAVITKILGCSAV